MQKHVGSILLLAVLSLVALGLIVLFSTSAKFAAGGSVAMYAYLRKQALWLVLGGVVCFALSKVDYRTLGRYAPHCVALSAFLMLACFVPFVGKTVKGAARWIEIAGLTAQPSEFAKFAFLVFLAFWLARHQEVIREFKRGFAIPVCVAGALSLILLKQRDLGSILMILMILAILMACAGVPWRYLLPVPLVGVVSILAVAWSMPERRGRLFAFMNLEAYKQNEGYQVYQGIIALGSGGPLGLGLGNSRQKMYYLPESHTDFIFPIIGEEMGMWIALAVVTAFLVIALCGGWITLHASDSAGVLLGVGVTSFLSIQAIMNLAVVTSMMPAKGVPLPFISYGGSNLLVCLACVGLLFNLQRNGVYEVPTAKEQLLPRRGRPRM